MRRVNVSNADVSRRTDARRQPDTKDLVPKVEDDGLLRHLIAYTIDDRLIEIGHVVGFGSLLRRDDVDETVVGHVAFGLGEDELALWLPLLGLCAVNDKVSMSRAAERTTTRSA